MNTLAVILVIAYAMPGRTPDITLQVSEETLVMCEADAHQFMLSGMPDIMREKGAIGLYAGCKVPDSHTVRD